MGLGFWVLGRGPVCFLGMWSGFGIGSHVTGVVGVADSAHPTSDGAVDGGGDFCQDRNGFGEGVGGDGLRTVGHGVGGVRVDLDDEAVGAAGDGGIAHGWDEACVSGALGRVDDDGEMGLLMDVGNDGEGEGVAGVVFESANAALAEDDVGVSGGEDVFGRLEVFVDGHGHAALVEDGLAGFAGGFEKLEVLGIAGADLEAVCVFGDEIDFGGGEDFGDDGEAGFLARLSEEFEAGFAEALEGVRVGTGLECAAAEGVGTSGFTFFGGVDDL